MKPVRIEVDIRKRLLSAHRPFELAVRFASSAARTVIFGPSGAGKSLTLRALAGLLTPDEGVIRFDGRTLFDATAKLSVSPRERRFGYLFQDYALFPHLTVRQNVAFALTPGLLNPGVAHASAAVDRWLAAFHLTDLARQMPGELSGGQRQRTALARALVNQPRALLLDEPFAALDTELRERMRSELDALLKDVDIPIVMITHDPQDLARFGEQVVQLRDGGVLAEPVAKDGTGALPPTASCEAAA